MGYSRAGFDVVGVDINPQPRYPFKFHQGDALEFVAKHGREFDAIHASPPCQAYTSMAAVNRKRWGHEPKSPRLIEPVRALLEWCGRPFVIENVVGSPLQSPIVLCGSMFGLSVRRHRLFECSFAFLNGLYCRHRGHHHVGVYGDHPDGGRLWARKDKKGGVHRRAASLDAGRQAMGADWMNWKELTQAIPPAYTEYLGKQLITYAGAA